MRKSVKVISIVMVALILISVWWIWCQHKDNNDKEHTYFRYQVEIFNTTENMTVLVPFPIHYQTHSPIIEVEDGIILAGMGTWKLENINKGFALNISGKGHILLRSEGERKSTSLDMCLSMQSSPNPDDGMFWLNLNMLNFSHSTKVRLEFKQSIPGAYMWQGTRIEKEDHNETAQAIEITLGWNRVYIPTFAKIP